MSPITNSFDTYSIQSPVKPLPTTELDDVVTQTSLLWAEARGHSFLITGGTGFFGMWLLESFARANDKLALGMRATVLTRDIDDFADRAPHLRRRADFAFVQGDVRSFSFPKGMFRYVIHAATDASAKLNEEDPEVMFDVIVNGTRRVLDFAAAAGTKKLLLVSSGAVYGRQPAGLSNVSEEYVGGPDPLDRRSAYAEGKRASEHLCAVHAWRHRYELKVARCFAFVGPLLPLDTHYAIGNFIRDAMRSGPIRVTGDGTAVRSYLYAADLAVWLWTILFRGSAFGAFNVGSDIGVSVGDLAKIVRDVVGGGYPVEISGTPDSTQPTSRYVPSIAKAKTLLGLRPTTDLIESIRRTCAWQRALH